MQNSYIVNNSIKQGDVLVLNNMFVGTSSVYDFSGQYKVNSVAGGTSSYITLDISSNSAFSAYATGNSSSLPMTVHGNSSSMLSNVPYFSLNKGKKIIVTRVSSSSSILTERYKVDIREL
jgi:hypothetical protein